MELPGRRKTTEMVSVVMKKGMQRVSVTEEHGRDRMRLRQMICCGKGPVKRRRRICIYHFRYRNLTHPLPDKSGFKGRGANIKTGFRPRMRQRRIILKWKSGKVT